MKPVPHGKPYAGKLHVRFDEGADVPDEGRPALLYWGASQFYPAIATACHVTRKNKPLKYRFDVAMTGRFGFELQPKWLKKDEVAFAKSCVENYKRIRPTIQLGDLYRLVSPYEKPLAALMYADESADRAVLFVLGLKIKGERKETLKLRGLDPEATYCVREINRGATLHANAPEAVKGRELMERGIEVSLRGYYDSAVFEIVRAK